MAYPSPFIKLTFSGGIAGEDIWSNGLNIGNTTGTPAALFAALNPATLANTVSTFYTGGATSMNTYNTLRTIKMALVGEDGKTIGEPKLYDYAPQIAGAANFTTPPQDSIVVSLLTAAVRGLAYRGRIYLPAGFGDVATGTGRLASGTVTSISTKTKTFLEGINTWAQAPTAAKGQLVVNSAVREGSQRQLSGFSIGNLVDNQRRRRNRLAEQYVETALTF